MADLRDDPEAIAAGFGVQLALAALHEEQYRAFLQEEANGVWGAEWMDAAATTDYQLQLTPELLRDLHAFILERIKTLYAANRDHLDDNSRRVVAIQFRAFPLQR